MPYQELPGLGMKGLNTDTPAQALDHMHFSEGNNMRPFDGSLQTVFSFAGNDDNITPALGAFPDGNRTDVLALSGWIETGANELRLAYIWNDGSASTPYNVQIINDLTTSGNFVEGANAATMLTDNLRWGQQLLAFNGVMLVNDSVNQPIVVFDASADATPEYVAQFVAGWLSSAYNDLDTTSQAAIDAATPDALTGTDLAYDGSNVAITYPKDVNDNDEGFESRTQFEQLNQAPLSRVTCERLLAYNGRLIALNLEGDYLGDNLGNASIVWSTPIDELGSLNNVTFRFSSTNSAGDDILTETPGEVIDGGVLGQYLIIYKDDAVYRYQDIGSPLFLVGEVQFADDGLYSPDCFADIGGGRHLVLGNYGVYIHQGGPERTNISRNRIQEALYSDIDKTDAQKDKTFLYHHENDKEVWICIPTTSGGDCDKAYIYNYEYDAWYTRDIPSLRGITSFQKDGDLWLLGFGANGTFRLGDERRLASTHETSSSIEMHYVDFGDQSKVKHISAVYPHTMAAVSIDVEGSNRLSAADEPEFVNALDFDPAKSYKQDRRLHGRYYHIKIANDGNRSNPLLTGFGADIKLGGDR